MRKPEWVKAWEKEHAAKEAAGLKEGGNRCRR